MLWGTCVPIFTTTLVGDSFSLKLPLQQISFHSQLQRFNWFIKQIKNYYSRH